MFESEERIAQRIKEYIKNAEFIQIGDKIMLKNGRILDIGNYRNMLSAGTIKPQDAYVFIDMKWVSSNAEFYYPFLAWYGDIPHIYLSKLGFHYGNFVFPATGLKYVVYPGRYDKYLSIELANLDTVVNNTNLRKIVFEVVGGKIINGEKELTYEEYVKISDMYNSQRLFVGHDFEEAWNIVHDYYYDEGNQSLAKEAARIVMEYYRIFNPYTICYDMNNWKEVDCWSIKL